MSEVIDIKQVRELTNIVKLKKTRDADHVLNVNSYIYKAAEKGMCGITLQMPLDVANILVDLYETAGYSVSVINHKHTSIVEIDWSSND